MSSRLALPALLALLLAACDPPSSIGLPCQLDAHCEDAPDGREIVCDLSVPGGYCSLPGCTPDDLETEPCEDDCPQGSYCIEIEEDAFACRPACSDAGDCRPITLCMEICEQEEPERCTTECDNASRCSPVHPEQRDPPWDAPRACTLERPETD
ncbi:MAG: hypothetical protein JXR96_02885 [Deltaproteobacteria bacterium]|nr:hypothetical protein [Deltaproteobacteria bacterium]